MSNSDDYWNAMDKRGFVNPDKISIDPHRVGISHGFGDLTEGLKANVFRGLTAVELGFFGTGKGQRSNPTGMTPESFTKSEREDIRQLAKINEIELSTHAAPDLGWTSGINRENTAFSPHLKENALHEIQRATEFAGDTTDGGAVVVHLSEFPRAIFEADEQFQAHPEEEKKAPVYLVDKQTGQIQGIPRDTVVRLPLKDKEGNYVRDDFGVVKFDNPITYEQLRQEEMKHAKAEGRTANPEKLFYDLHNARQIESAKGEVGRWSDAAEGHRKEYERLEEIKKQYEDLKKTSKNEKAIKEFLQKGMEEGGYAPRPAGFRGQEQYQEFQNKPEEYLKELIAQEKYRYEYNQSTAMSASKQLQEAQDNKERFEPIQDYGVRESADTIARAAMHAYDVEKKKDLERPLFISPENWTPETYGNHPQEYKKIIQESRKAMENMLLTREKASSKEEAQKIAREHIKGTFDIGHLNFWRKYFKGSDEDFDKWVEKESKDLMEEGITGNVHLSDNFGYHDEHLTPGEGNAPIERFIEHMEKAGYKGRYIGEPGGQHQHDIHKSWTGSLKTANSPIYKTADPMQQSWNYFEQSHFGNVPQSPYFLVGDVAPSKDWSLWSETPLE